MDLDGANILITGGTGSFGNRLVDELLENHNPDRIVIFSRDELKQFHMRQKYPISEFTNVRMLIGDVRDRERLYQVTDGIDVIVHAAALKQVPAAEYNPFEVIKTNVIGGQNTVEAAISAGVKKVIALSTDKAAAPINLYGATKLCSDKLFVAANNFSGGFVVDLAVQKYKGYNIIWGATVAAESGEKNGISFSIDNGDTWNSTLIGKRAYNIEVSDSIVLVASSTGLWKTLTDNPLDIDKPWARYNQVKQAIKLGSTGVYDMDEILSDEVIGVSYDSRSYYSKSAIIWIGSWDGLARAMDSEGTNWKIYRANFDPDKVYAYPNPFSPYDHNQFQGSGYVHIHADVKLSFVVKMDIFNFGMEPVLQKQFDRRQASTGSLKWDGKDKNGRMVDNGTYFIRLEYDQKIKWIKLIVIK